MTNNSHNFANPIMRMKNISKSFSGYTALKEVSLDVFPGEVLCLLGDNGAGKSTAIKVLSGFHGPSSGTMEWEGGDITFNSPRDANEMGIATVHQFGGTFPLMSIARSFFVGLEPTKGRGPFKRFDRKYANEVVVREMQALGITRVTDGERLIGSLSGGERQVSAIARAVHFGAKVLILDEPTNHLDLKSKDVLKEALLNFDGTLILVSHDRDFLQGLSQKVFEFKDQRVIEHFETIDDFLVRNRIENLKQIDLKK